MTERLQRLKQKRGVVRASTTKLLRVIEEETSQDDVSCDRVRELLSMLSVKEANLLELQKEIEEDIPMDELEADIVKTVDYQDNITLWKARVTRLIEREGAAAGERISPRLSDGSAHSSRLSSRPTVKLPKLYINKYDGEISLWQEFWDQFQTAIHENFELSKTEKLTYLKSYLVGPAARAIAGLKITESNYDAAIDMLKERFGRKDLIVSAHMSKLLSLTPVKRSSDIVALRRLYDECEVQIRGLEAMGVVSDTYGGLLCPILLQMIPDDLALAYTREIGSDHELKVPGLVAFLQHEVESRECAMHLTKAGSHSKESHSPPPQQIHALSEYTKPHGGSFLKYL